MNRYHPARRTGNHHAGHIVAFLLIACFGLLFVTGCSQVRGPEEIMEDDTFTAEDAERFSQVQTSIYAMSGSGVQGGDGGVLAGLPAGSGATSSIDPALRKRYETVRKTTTSSANLYRVTNAFLNVRATPNVTGAFVVRLNQGDMVSVVEFVNAGWAKVSVAGAREGYVATRYIAKLTTEEKLKEEEKAFENLYFVNFSFVNVRASADSQSDKLGEIPGQAFVKPLRIEGEWARVAFEGKEGYVTTQYLTAFRPNMLVRQERYQLPILHYAVDREGMLTQLAAHLTRLKQSGARFLTVRDFADTVLAQEVRDVRIAPKSVIVAISGLTGANSKQVSDALTPLGVRATFFIQTDRMGISGISDKMLLTLQANGFDIESAGHTGDDLRILTNAQTELELLQSRTLIERVTHSTVLAIAYPQGGANDRVLSQAADAGYLFGMGSAPDNSFSRDQFLRLPSYTVTTGMTPEDVLTLVK